MRRGSRSQLKYFPDYPDPDMSPLSSVKDDPVPESVNTQQDHKVFRPSVLNALCDTRTKDTCLR